MRNNSILTKHFLAVIQVTQTTYGSYLLTEVEACAAAAAPSVWVPSQVVELPELMVLVG